MNIKYILVFAIGLFIGIAGMTLVGNNQPSVGGSTSSDWNVGGNLAVTGTSSFTGAVSFVGALVADIFTEGGGTVTITPETSTVTLTEANLLAGNVITFVASTTMPALTVTLPATSTMATLLASDGDRRNWTIENPFTAAATTTTIAAGTGIDLQEPDGQNVVIGINNYAWLTCFREASTDVVCSVSETIPAD